MLGLRRRVPVFTAYGVCGGEFFMGLGSRV